MEFHGPSSKYCCISLSNYVQNHAGHIILFLHHPFEFEETAKFRKQIIASTLEYLISMGGRLLIFEQISTQYLLIL